MMIKPAVGNALPASPTTAMPALRVPRMAAVIGVFFAATSVGALLLGTVQTLLRVDAVIIELAQFGPTLGVLTVLLVWRGRWRPPLAAGLALRKYLLVQLLTVAVTAACIFGAVLGAYELLGADVHYTPPGTLTHPFWQIAVAQLLGACAEEYGWRCFLQPYLRTRYGVVTSGTIVGLLWGVWHVQVFAFGPAYAVAFLTSTIAISIIMAVVLDGARGHNLLVAGSLHALLNLGLLLLLAEEGGDLTAQVIFAAACAVVAAWAGARHWVRGHRPVPGTSTKGKLMTSAAADAGRTTAWRGWVAAPGRGLLLVGLAYAKAATVLALAAAAILIPLGVGVYLFPPLASSLRKLANRSRTWSASWSQVTVSEPSPWVAGRSGFIGQALRCWAILSDRGFWREVVWAIVDPMSGAVLAVMPFGLIVYGLFGALVQPFIWEIIDRAGGSNWYAMVHVDSPTSATLAIPVGVVFTLLGIWSGPWWLRVHARHTRSLLAPGHAELVRRVEQLTDTRAVVADDSAAELRRIERDLHDGAQARLVAMGMNLDAAERLLRNDPDSARALLVQARQASSAALQELRDLVRGIHPPVLADRGLPDAVRALALDTVLDVTVDAELAARMSPPVEAAAYFAISELLANAAKHADATRVMVDLRHRDGLLCIEVSDDGSGGADAAHGTGLRGIHRRLAAFDGTVAVHSPRGGPTTVRMEVPCALSSPKTSTY